MNYSSVYKFILSIFAAETRLGFSLYSDETASIFRYTRTRHYTYVSQKRELRLSIF